jgi:hypothetical protein
LLLLLLLRFTRALVWVELGLALAQNLAERLRRGLSARVWFRRFLGGNAL